MIELHANRWQLPDGVNELLPENAWCVEALRRRVMDNAGLWGYELVMPPLIEYLDGLLTGTGEQLNLQTFKLVDQHNGRTLGIRADMTPQVARMDAHALQSEHPNRLFYTGSVLRARTDGAGSSRTPLQFGAELFGHAGPESDAEIIQLMLENATLAGLPEENLLLDIGHVGVYRALVDETQLEPDFEKRLFQALVRGSRPEVMALLQEYENGSAPVIGTRIGLSDGIKALMRLSGVSGTVLKAARKEFADAGAQVHSALDNLQAVLGMLGRSNPSLQVHVDLAELRGYAYHTGILFTLYDTNGVQLARGGRYDAIGEAFGRARAATGFSGDLITLALTQRPLPGAEPSADSKNGIWVGSDVVGQAAEHVRLLRSKGERVVSALPGSSATASTSQCDRHLVLRDGQFVVEASNR